MQPGKRISFEGKNKTGIITGLSFAKDRNEKCRWFGIAESMTTIAFVLEEMDFDCSAGQLNLTLKNPMRTVNLCDVPGRRGAIGSSETSFLLRAALSKAGQAVTTRLRLRYYRELYSKVHLFIDRNVSVVFISKFLIICYNFI